MLGHGEGEQHVLDLGRRRLAARDDLQVGRLDQRAVARLHQEAAGHRAEHLARAVRVGQAVSDQQPQVLLGGEDGLGFVVGAGRDDDLGEDVGDGARVIAVQRAVDGDDAAEGRDGVAFQRAGVGL